MCNPLTSWTHSPIISCQSWSISVLSSTQYYPQCNPVCTCSPHKSTSYFLLFKVQINTLSTLLILKSFSFAPSFPLSAPNHCTPILSCFYLLLCLFSLVLVGNHFQSKGFYLFGDFIFLKLFFFHLLFRFLFK